MLRHSGFTAIMMSQPMARYKIVESRGNLAPPKDLRRTPASAIPQTSPNSVQPQGPRRTPSVNGVYVPAISKKMK